MSSWWEKFKEQGSVVEKSTKEIKAEEESLARCCRRLIEILEESGEIGKIFDEVAKLQVNPLLPEEEFWKAAADSMNRLRVPGFYAYKYAQEGIILITLIGAKAAHLKITYEGLGITSELKRLDEILDSLDETYNELTSTLENLSHHHTLDGAQVLEEYMKKTYGTKK